MACFSCFTLQLAMYKHNALDIWACALQDFPSTAKLMPLSDTGTCAPTTRPGLLHGVQSSGLNLQPLDHRPSMLLTHHLITHSYHVEGMKTLSHSKQNLKTTIVQTEEVSTSTLKKQPKTSSDENPLHLLSDSLWYDDLIKLEVLSQFVQVVHVHDLTAKLCARNKTQHQVTISHWSGVRSSKLVSAANYQSTRQGSNLCQAKRFVTISATVHLLVTSVTHLPYMSAGRSGGKRKDSPP